MKKIIGKSDVVVIVATPPDGKGEAFVAEVVDSEDVAQDLIQEMNDEWPQYVHTMEYFTVRGYE